MPTVRSRSYVFTLNNYDDDNVAHLNLVLANTAMVNYAVYGFEVGASGTPHVQGYVSFATVKSMSQVKRFLGSPRVHVEVAKGTAEENRVYCIKDGDHHSFGILPRQRQVTYIEVIDLTLD